MAQQIKTALVVDDSRLARIALCKLLKNRGIEVDMAGCGSEAMERLRATRPDVVFMDYMMPDMDGFEASRQVLAEPACGNPPIVMYTSQDTDEDRIKAREIGISGFLSKPTTESALDEVLGALASGTARSVAAPAQPQVAAVGAVAAPAAPPRPAVAAVPSQPDPELIRTVAHDAAERVAQRHFEQLRHELAEGLAAAMQQAGEAAEQRAAAAVDSAVERLAAVPQQEPVDLAALEARTREIAETAAQEAAAGVARDAGASAARALSPQLVDEARRAALEAVDSADLQGRLQTMVEQDVVPGLRQELLVAAKQAADAAVETALDERIAELELRLQQTAQQSAAAEARGMRGGILGAAIAAGAVAGAVAGVVAAMVL